MSAADPPSLRVARLTVRFGGRPALVGVDLIARPGEFVALAGPNGSGKTTLLRTLLGFVPADEGTVEVGGSPVASLAVRERARRLAWVPQEETTRDDVPLIDYVLFGRYAHLGALEGPTADDRAQAERALVSVGLADRRADGVLALSGGERQRAVLARALVQGAPILLLDEPTAHLDIGHQLDLLARVRALARAGTVTVLAALHDLNLAARFADRIVVLSRGRKVADGPPRAVLSAELLARVWGVVGAVREEPRSGVPYLIPFRPASVGGDGPAPLGVGPVHVVGGGGAASPVLRTLVDAGYRVTAGVLHLMDTDQETAQELGVPTAVELPFVPIGDEARTRGRTLLGAARLVAVAPFPVGPSNLANLEELSEVVGRVPVVLVGWRNRAAWDFSDGAATELVRRLRERGAVDVDTPEQLLARCAAFLAAPPVAP